jgi:hypothetical protein
MKKIVGAFNAVSMSIIALHVWAAVSVSHWNWGLHFFAFYPLPVSLAAFILSLLVLFPAFQQKMLRLLEPLVHVIAKRPLPLILLILCGIVVLLALSLPAKLHLLGDGALVLRVISGIQVMDELPPNFNHQPLVGVVFKFLVNHMKSGATSATEKLFQGLDIAAGIVFLLLLVFFLRSLKLSPLENFFSGCFIFTAAGSQFFLGYVELYVLLYLATFAYLTTAWFTLEHGKTIIIPLLCFGLMCGLHFGSLLLAPSLLFLLTNTFQKRRSEGIITFASIILAITLAVWLKRSQFPSLIENFQHEVWFNFLPFFKEIQYFPYTMFSLAHVIDWLNALMLMAPFSPVILMMTLYKHKGIPWTHSTILFYLTTALCGLLFTFTLNPALGLARDWDFLASFFLPLVFLCFILSKQFFNTAEFRTVFIAVVFLSFLHWGGWVGVNASEERHLQRMLLLNEPKFLSSVPRLNYYETLGNFFWHRGQYQQSQYYWEEYARIDSTNPRTVANLSEVYRKVGDKEKAFEMLQRAANLNSPSPAVYMNLGVMYAQRGDTTTAIALNQRAIRMDTTYAKAHANLGFLYARRGRYKEAAHHFSQSLAYGLTEPFIYREMGSVYFFLNQLDSSLAYYNIYLEQVPGDVATQKIRDRLALFIQTIQR